MRYQTATGFSRWTLPAFALLWLQGCASGPDTVYMDRPVEIPVPFVQVIDQRLTLDCEPRTDIPQSGKLTVRQAKDRLAAVEDALAFCRNQLAEIRAVR